MVKFKGAIAQVRSGQVKSSPGDSDFGASWACAQFQRTDPVASKVHLSACDAHQGAPGNPAVHVDAGLQQITAFGDEVLQLE